METFVVIVSIATNAVITHALPPPACFANFRWDDCGRSPEPVMYYWKTGSRCEVGIWRGCLPNINMFRDEYECVSTCIFSVRALAPDWHKIKSEEEITEEPDLITESVTNGTETVEDAGTTGAGGEDATGGGGDGGGGEGGGGGGDDPATDVITTTTEDPAAR